MDPTSITAAPGPVLTPTLPAAPTPFVPHRSPLPPETADIVPSSAEWTGWTATEWLAAIVLVVLVTAVVVVLTRRIVWKLGLVRQREHRGDADLDGDVLPPAHAFTALVVAREGPAGLATTLDLVAGQSHPDVVVLAVVPGRDVLAVEAARSAARRHGRRVDVVLVPEGEERSAAHGVPRSALDRALAVPGERVVAVFEAGDRPHPGLFALVDSVLTRTGADVVRHAAQLPFEDDPWWLPRIALDQWWSSRAVDHANDAAVFAGSAGSTPFVRRAWLAWSGDAAVDQAAEGLGASVRLSRAGARVVVTSSPGLATVEKVPRHVGALMRTRRRWARDCLQVLGEGDWRGLRPRARRRALITLTVPFVDATVTVVLASTVVSLVAVAAPASLIALAVVPVVPALVDLLLDQGATTEAAASRGRRAGPGERVLVAVAALPVRLLDLAAVVGALRDVLGRREAAPTDAG